MHIILVSCRGSVSITAHIARVAAGCISTMCERLSAVLCAQQEAGLKMMECKLLRRKCSFYLLR